MFHPEVYWILAPHTKSYIQALEGAIWGELMEIRDILNTLSADHKQYFQIILDIIPKEMGSV